VISCRTYGERGPAVILIHGGPGAPGYLAPLARRLADTFRVIEPFQRRSGGEGAPPLSVAQHVNELHEFMQEHCCGERPHLVGHSWGAMLALAYAAGHPDVACSIVLIGCGTFDQAARDRMNAIRAKRMTPDIQARYERLREHYSDENQQLKAAGRLHQLIDSVDLIKHTDESADFDARGHDETWSDMLRLQREGLYPAAFAAIRVPVLMLHGAQDPHPGAMIRDSLRPRLPQLEYVEFEHCGHYPWIERAAHEEFNRVFRQWLSAHSS
jgi:pimeloyl-ACP methyl ester carboxylesterase